MFSLIVFGNFLSLRRLNHKFLGLIYLFLSFYSGLVGLRFSLVLRLELSHLGFFFGRGQIYNSILSRHALVIIFFIVIPALIGGFGNYLVPIFIFIGDLI